MMTQEFKQLTQCKKTSETAHEHLDSLIHISALKMSLDLNKFHICQESLSDETQL